MQSAAASNSAAKVGISGAGVLGGGLVTTKQTVLASSKFKLSPLTELFFSLYGKRVIRIMLYSDRG